MPTATQLCVCYFVTGFPHPSETFIADEAQSLRDMGARVFIVHLYAGDVEVVHPTSANLLADGIVRRVPRLTIGGLLRGVLTLLRERPLQTLSGLRSMAAMSHRRTLLKAIPVAAWCITEGVEFLHAHFADSNWAFAHAVAHWTRLPVGVTTHRYDLLDAPLGVERAARLFEHTQVVVTVSEWNRRYLAERFDVPSARTRVVHCGVDVDEFSFVDRSRQSSETPLRLLSVGRLVPVKGHAILLQALARARAAQANLCLAIVGGGPLEAALREQANSLGLDDVVTFHGTQPRPVVLEQLERCDVFVLPSLSEGIPVACMEAMATGAVVVASDVNGLPELISDGTTGRLVKASDIDSLADALIWAYEHRDQLPAMGHAAREWIIRHFNRAEVSRELLRLMSPVGVPEAR